MDLATLTTFFAWCSAINGAFLLILALFLMAAPGVLYSTQKKWFPGTRETHGVVMYAFMAGFKLLYLVFNLVPYLVLRLAL